MRGTPKKYPEIEPGQKLPEAHPLHRDTVLHGGNAHSAAATEARAPLMWGRAGSYSGSLDPVDRTDPAMLKHWLEETERSSGSLEGVSASTAEVNPALVERLSQSLENVSPRAVLLVLPSAKHLYSSKEGYVNGIPIFSARRSKEQAKTGRNDRSRPAYPYATSSFRRRKSRTTDRGDRSPPQCCGRQPEFVHLRKSEAEFRRPKEVTRTAKSARFFRDGLHSNFRHKGAPRCPPPLTNEPCGIHAKRAVTRKYSARRQHGS